NVELLEIYSIDRSVPIVDGKVVSGILIVKLYLNDSRRLPPKGADGRGRCASAHDCRIVLGNRREVVVPGQLRAQAAAGDLEVVRRHDVHAFRARIEAVGEVLHDPARANRLK